MTPARYLRLLRRRRRLSQEALAWDCGWDQSQISALERGRLKFSVPVVATLARVLADRQQVLRRLVNGEAVRICDDCGCHDFDACMGTHDMPCHWPGPRPAEGPDRCSQCAQIAAGEGRAAA